MADHEQIDCQPSCRDELIDNEESSRSILFYGMMPTLNIMVLCCVSPFHHNLIRETLETFPDVTTLLMMGDKSYCLLCLDGCTEVGELLCILGHLRWF